jgi:hypothetical protein
MLEHEFTFTIKQILTELFGNKNNEIFEKSYLIQYLNKKTKAANKGSKSRSSFANHYAIYVLVEDYILKGFLQPEFDYSEYEGAKYTDIFQRMRELPFGNKLQNHALNSRMNEEFKKFFPDILYQPILRDIQTKRYWINEKLLIIRLYDGQKLNIAKAIIKIISAYIEARKSAFDQFISYCSSLANISNENLETVIEFINSQIQPNVDARIFEIVSYAILKAYYSEQIIYWGWNINDLTEENLKLYKTGRTNANDGGIDFVMKPLGRFFQVTETLDINKYFLDIDKIQRYPITFVIKTEKSENEVLTKIEENAINTYIVKAIVKRYMDSIEEIINIPYLRRILNQLIQDGKTKEIMNEIILQSKVEFNYDENDD